LNLELTRTKDHGDFEPEDLYHEKVIILDKLKEQIWKNNIIEMRIQTMADVAPISIAPTPNLFHHNNVGNMYVGIFNFIVEPIRFVQILWQCPTRWL
jgi:hypothetical protein